MQFITTYIEEEIKNLLDQDIISISIILVIEKVDHEPNGYIYIHNQFVFVLK